MDNSEMNNYLSRMLDDPHHDDWDPNRSYNLDECCIRDGVIFISLENNNKNEDPRSSLKWSSIL